MSTDSLAPEPPLSKAERIRRRKHASYLRNRETQKAHERAARAAEPERFRSYEQRYRAAHRAIINARQQARRAANRERMRALDNARRAANPEKQRAYEQRYREANRDKINARHRARRAADPEAARARERAQHAANREKERARELARRRANREQVNAKARAYLAAHRDEINARRRAVYAANRERELQRMRTLRAAHPERFQAYCTARRARVRAAPQNDFTAAQWKTVKAQQGYRCAYCGAKPKRLEIDHITPLSRGGAHSLANIVAACRTCNARKNAGKVLAPVQPLLL